jgi:hypothetical protein
MDALRRPEPVTKWRQNLRSFRGHGYNAAFCLTFVLFMGVRVYHLDQAPAHNDTTDEYAWTWSGMTLLQTGKPRAWSNLKAYLPNRETLDWRDHRYNLVEPWLDHPPVYSLYAGAWMLAWGKRDIFAVDLWQMCAGSLPLAALSFVFLGAFLRYFLAPAALLISLVFYSVMPLLVWHQRLVVSENLAVPLTLGALLLLQAQLRRFASWRVFALVFVSALLALTKVAALSCSVLLVLWALASDTRAARWVNAGALVMGTCAGITRALPRSGICRTLDPTRGRHANTAVRRTRAQAGALLDTLGVRQGRAGSTWWRLEARKSAIGFGRRPDISTLRNYPTSLFGFDISSGVPTYPAPRRPQNSPRRAVTAQRDCWAPASRWSKRFTSRAHRSAALE